MKPPINEDPTITMNVSLKESQRAWIDLKSECFGNCGRSKIVQQLIQEEMERENSGKDHNNDN